jgi:hypothetical protein
MISIGHTDGVTCTTSPKLSPQYRLAFERKGILRGQSALADSGGTNWQFCNAIRAGGPRNGVLTAIEDFLADHPSEYLFCRIRFQEGLGILQARSNHQVEDRAFLPIRIAAGWQSLCASPRTLLRYVLRKAFPSFTQKAVSVMVAAPRTSTNDGHSNTTT